MILASLIVNYYVCKVIHSAIISIASVVRQVGLVRLLVVINIPDMSTIVSSAYPIHVIDVRKYLPAVCKTELPSVVIVPDSEKIGSIATIHSINKRPVYLVYSRVRQRCSMICSVSCARREKR